MHPALMGPTWQLIIDDVGVGMGCMHEQDALPWIGPASA